MSRNPSSDSTPPESTDRKVSGLPLRRRARRTTREKVEKKKTFASVEHLSAEAVAAFVDNELDAGAAHRARIHLVHCPDCRQEVETQRIAAASLRATCQEIHAPRSLLDKLQSIASSCPQGPSAEDTACQAPDGLLDKIDFYYRALVKQRGNNPRQ